MAPPPKSLLLFLYLTVGLCLLWIWKVNYYFLSSISAIRSSDDDEIKFHLVFSTGCSAFQDWQSYAFFFHVYKVQQKGHVTRVASGCNAESAKALLQNHATYIHPMSDQFHLHLTPDYSKVIPGDDYKFFNKPMGLHHWMQNALRMNTTEGMALHQDTIFVILDPDQFVTKPFLQDYTNEQIIWNKKKAFFTKIQRGRPMAQLYGFGSHWTPQIKPDELVGTEKPSPLRSWTRDLVETHYAAGPPYAAVGSDMYQIVKTWADFVVNVYRQTRDHLSEMFAYSTAAAHLGLKHQLVVSWMLSNTDMGTSMEPWEWIDDPASQTCPGSPGREQLPQTLHYCQRYFAGPFFFSKYQVWSKPEKPMDFLSCEHPLYAEPKAHEIVNYNKSQTLDGNWHDLNPRQARRQGFMLCQVLARMNEMALFFKQHHCRGNYNDSKVFFHPMHKQP